MIKKGKVRTDISSFLDNIAAAMIGGTILVLPVIALGTGIFSTLVAIVIMGFVN